jgi:hypothetical protein
MAFLGKSKSEQYLGFLPYFAHLEMYVDNILIQLKETYSQIIILVITVGSLINSYLTLVISQYKQQALHKIFLAPVHNNKKFIKNYPQTKLKVRQNQGINWIPYYNLVYSLSKFQNSLKLINLNRAVSSGVSSGSFYKGNISFKNSLKANYIQNTSSHTLNYFTSPMILNSEKPYLNCFSKNINLKANPINQPNLNNFLKITATNTNLSQYDFNLNGNLASAKELR